MIMTVEEFKQHVKTDVSDDVLETRLRAVEGFIHNHTNNHFAVRGMGRICDVVGGMFITESLQPYSVGDTLHISGSDKNDGLYTVKEAEDAVFTVNEKTRDEIDVYVRLVEYPADVKMGAVELVKYDLEHRERAGIQSETISRHSVTYKVPDASDTLKGYPKHLMGFLDGYMKARFGQGVKV